MDRQRTVYQGDGGGRGGGEENRSRKKLPGVKMCRVRVFMYDEEMAKYQQVVVTLAAPEHTTHHFI